MKNEHPKVAVVMLCWNGWSFVDAFLPSIIQYSTYPNTEIVVADNCSSDGTADKVRVKYPSVTVIENDANYGFAGGYNAALKKVEADYYVLFNQDAEAAPNWMEPVMQMMVSDSNIAAAQPKIKAQKAKNLFEYAGASGGYMDALGYTFCRGRIFGDVEPDNDQYDKSASVFWASGACMFVQAKLYHDVGGLDERFFAHMEEIDLCWRLKNLGFDIKAVPESTVYHVGGGSLNYGNPRKTYLNYRNSLMMMHKNLSVSSLLWKLPLRMILDGVAGIYMLYLGQPKDLIAIFKAHIGFYQSIPSTIQRRNSLKQLRTGKSINIKGLFNGSIVLAYFIKGQKIFSQLSENRFTN